MDTLERLRERDVVRGERSEGEDRERERERERERVCMCEREINARCEINNY